MSRSVERSGNETPALPDTLGWRHFGDGTAGQLTAARIQGYSSALLDYVDVAVDSSGNLLATLSASSIEIGTVDQGAAGASPWLVALPSGASTGVKQDTGNTSLASIDSKLTNPLPVSLASVPSHPVTNAGTFAVQASVSNFPATQAISAASLPLPTGAATEAGNLATIAAKDFATQTTLALIKAKTDNLDVALSTRTKPADSQHTTIDNASIAITAAALPLPTGAAQDATLTSGTAKTQLYDGAATYVAAKTGQLPTALVSGRLSVDIGGQALAKLLATVDPITFASPQHMILDSGAVTATLSAETTKVIGAVNQGTSPWVVSGGANVFHIDDNAGSLTVDGSVTATLSSNVVATKTVLTASAPTTATVGVTSASAVAADANRKGLVLINTSANAISLGIGATAVLNSGITLNASGGTWEMDEYTFTTAAINAIAAGASSNLAIQEFTT